MVTAGVTADAAKGLWCPTIDTTASVLPVIDKIQGWSEARKVQVGISCATPKSIARTEETLCPRVERVLQESRKRMKGKSHHANEKSSSEAT